MNIGKVNRDKIIKSLIEKPKKRLGTQYKFIDFYIKKGNSEEIKRISEKIIGIQNMVVSYETELAELKNEYKKASSLTVCDQQIRDEN